MGHLLQPLPGAGAEQKGIERLRKLFSGAVVGERFLELLQRLHNGLRRLANQLELLAVLLQRKSSTSPRGWLAKPSPDGQSSWSTPQRKQ